jgi:hypothetical protein
VKKQKRKKSTRETIPDNLKPHAWKPGESGNPLGGKLHNPVIRAIKAMTRTQLAEVGTLLVEQDLTTLEQVAKSRTEPALRVWFATIAVEAIKKKEFWAFNGLLDRIVGKVAERTELTGANGGPVDSRNVSLIMTPEERLLEIERLRALREKAGND